MIALAGWQHLTNLQTEACTEIEKLKELVWKLREVEASIE